LKRLDVLTKFYELWDYALIVVSGKNVPNYLRYSVGEEILKELKTVGWNLKYSNIPTITNFARIKSVKDADESFQQVKFDFDLLMAYKNISQSREHLYTIEAEFGKMLGGWRNYLTSNGTKH